MALALLVPVAPRRPRKATAPRPGFVKLMDGSHRTPPARLAAHRPCPTGHPLILDGLAVTFYLVFKEPASPRPPSRSVFMHETTTRRALRHPHARPLGRF
jgi:hypothetical protein